MAADTIVYTTQEKSKALSHRYVWQEPIFKVAFRGAKHTPISNCQRSERDELGVQARTLFVLYASIALRAWGAKHAPDDDRGAMHAPNYATQPYLRTCERVRIVVVPEEAGPMSVANGHGTFFLLLRLLIPPVLVALEERTHADVRHPDLALTFLGR